MQRFGSGVAERVVPVVGRAAESDVLNRFVVPGARRRALVLVGDAGIGKTTLWEATVALARQRGFLVLCARAHVAEAGFPFAALADLLDGVDLGRLTDVPAPQRRALEVAMQRVDPFASPPERFAFAAGFLSTVRSLAASAALLIAIDDVASLDRPSAQALSFAARRLSTEPTVHQALLETNTIERSGIRSYARDQGITLEDGAERLVSGLALRYFAALAA